MAQIGMIMDDVRVCEEMGTHETQRPINWSVERIRFQRDMQHAVYMDVSLQIATSDNWKWHSGNIQRSENG